MTLICLTVHSNSFVKLCVYIYILLCDVMCCVIIIFTFYLIVWSLLSYDFIGCFLLLDFCVAYLYSYVPSFSVTSLTTPFVHQSLSSRASTLEPTEKEPAMTSRAKHFSSLSVCFCRTRAVSRPECVGTVF